MLEITTDTLPQEFRRRMGSRRHNYSNQSAQLGVAVEPRLAHYAEGLLEGQPIEQLLAGEQDYCVG